MLIDWFTVIAQAINFLILVWLLKRLLYRPVLAAIDERERRVAAQLKDAADQKAAATLEREEYRQRKEEIARQGESLLREAADKAENERRHLLDQARREAERLRDKLHADVRDEQEALGREITDRAQHEVFAIARKALTDLADVSLEERVVAAFLRRLRGLSAEAKQKVAAFLKASRHPVLVRSAFDLSPEQRSAITLAIRETLDAEGQVQFQTNEALVGGIELTTDGHTIAWSIADYLKSLQRSVDALLPDPHDQSG